MSTVLVMAVHWRVSLRRTGEPDMDMLSQHNLRLIGFSFGMSEYFKKIKITYSCLVSN